MSDYSLVNLLDIESSAKSEKMKARFARKHLDSRDLGVSLFEYEPNHRSEIAHSHTSQEEAYVVVKGSGRILLGDEVKDLNLWDVVRVAPEVVRAFEAGGDGLSFIAVGGPKPADGDGVMAEPNWPDAA